MGHSVKNIILHLPRFRGTEKLIRRSGIRVIFPFYHSVSDTPDPWIRHLYRQKTVIEFERDIEWLTRYFKPVTLKELLTADPEQQKEARMVLSFDDGLQTCAGQIAPILQKKGIPAVFFLNNNFIDNKDLFFRYKASILIEHLENSSSAALKKEVGRLMDTTEKKISGKLLSVRYEQQQTLDDIAALCGISFHDYLKSHPVYLNTEQVQNLLHSGFEIGAHSEDHPFFGDLDPDEMAGYIKRSVDRLTDLFSLTERYFAFPFTDNGVPETVISELFEKKIIDAGFGTAGLKTGQQAGYYQRIPMEISRLSAKKVIDGEFFYFGFKKIIGLNGKK